MSKSNGTEARVQVAVRARPLNQREVKDLLLFFLLNLTQFILLIRLNSNLQLLLIFVAHKYLLINLKKSKTIFLKAKSFSIIYILEITHPKHFHMIFVLIQCG